MEIDKVDLAILLELQRDADAQRKQIAHNVSITESNLSKRITALRAVGYIKRFTIEIDYALLGYLTSAITFIKFDVQSDDTIEQLLTAAKASPNCVEIATVAGEWDVRKMALSR